MQNFSPIPITWLFCNRICSINKGHYQWYYRFLLSGHHIDGSTPFRTSVRVDQIEQGETSFMPEETTSMPKPGFEPGTFYMTRGKVLVHYAVRSDNVHRMSTSSLKQQIIFLINNKLRSVISIRFVPSKYLFEAFQF